MSDLDLPFIWFGVFVILITAYAILDGFDLGVGIFHLFSKSDKERRLMLNSIGPVWDGNEVWLVTGGGALFAGFPIMYATLCSAFYIPIMVLLGGIIFRAVAIEFRSKRTASWWRWMWDVLFSFASFVIALGLGLVMGNLIEGIPLDENYEYVGTFSDLVTPYALMIGVFAVSIFSMHGLIYALMKTEGQLHDKLRDWINPSIILFICMYVVATATTLIYQEHMADMIRERPWFFLIALVNMGAIAMIPREITREKDGAAFLFSCFNIICLMTLYGVGTYPNVIRASNGPQELSLTIWNSASSDKTLGILLLIAVIGVPMVIGYTTVVYTVFRGKVRLDSTSY